MDIDLILIILVRNRWWMRSFWTASCQSWNCEEFNYSLKEPTVVSHILFQLLSLFFFSFWRILSFLHSYPINLLYWNFFSLEKEILRESEIFLVNRSWKGTDQKISRKRFELSNCEQFKEIEWIVIRRRFYWNKIERIEFREKLNNFLSFSHSLL